MFIKLCLKTNLFILEINAFFKVFFLIFSMCKDFFDKLYVHIFDDKKYCGQTYYRKYH